MKPNLPDNKAVPLTVEANSTTPQPAVTHEQAPFSHVEKYPLPAPDMPMANPVPIDTLADTLGVATSQWQFCLSWQPTAVPKSGWLNKLRSQTHLIDLDLSCILYDVDGKVLERVWFKNVRDNSEAVRHRGDSLDGRSYKDTEDKNLDKNQNITTLPDLHIDQEKIEISLRKIPAKVHFLAFVVSSFYGQSLSRAVDGRCHLSDDEGNLISDISFAKLPRDCNALWFATLSRSFNSWFLTNNQQALSSPKLAQFEQEIAHQLTVLFPSVPVLSAGSSSVSSLASPNMIIRPRA